MSPQEQYYSPDMVPTMNYYQPSHSYNNHYDDNNAGEENILFVYNIGKDPDEADLIQLFENFGQVYDIRLVRHPDTGNEVFI